MDVAALRKALAAGTVVPDGVLLAAFLGHPAAKELVPKGTKIPTAPDDITGLTAALAKVPFDSDDYRHVAITRVTLAITRPILPLAAKRREHDSATAFHATETWCLCPCEACAEPLTELCRSGLTPREPLELQMQYHVAGVALDRKYAPKVIAAAEKLLGKTPLRPLVVSELTAWALKTNDPVKASVGPRTIWWLDPRNGDEGVRTAQLTAALRTRLAPIAEGKVPSFKTPPEIPITTGEKRNMLPNELGLLIVSDALKAKFGKILDYAEVTLKRGSKTERAWIAYAKKPLAALHQPRHRSDQSPILDPNLVANAPPLFRLEDAHGDCYLVDADWILDVVSSGLPVGIRAHGATFGCPLKPARSR